MPIGVAAAGIGAAGAIGAAAITSSAANSATKASQQAADQSLALQQNEFNTTQQEQKPFLTTGTSALNQLGSLYGLDTVDPSTGAVTPGSSQPPVNPNATFYQTPDYQFALTQGEQGLNASAAAAGLLNSGAALKAGATFASGLATQDYNNYANRLMGLAQIGQGAANTSANANANFANMGTNTLTNNANNVGNIALAQGASTSNNLNSLIGNLTATNANKSSYGSGILGLFGNGAGNGAPTGSNYGAATSTGLYG